MDNEDVVMAKLKVIAVYLQIKLYVFSLKMETHEVWVSELVMYEVRC